MNKSYPFPGLTKRQREVFEQISINKDLGHPESTLKALIKKGLIEQSKQMLYWGYIYRYEVPLNIHMQWCEWCSTLTEEQLNDYH